MLHCIDHIGVFVEDLATATRSYAALLGRSPTWRGVRPASGAGNTIFRLANTCIELIAPESAASPLAKELAERGEGIAFLAFGTADAVDARARCVAAGLEAAEPVDGLMQDTGSGAFRQSLSVDLPRAQTAGVPITLVEQRSPEAFVQPAPPTGDEAACVGLLDHVVVMTPAPERAIGLYRDQLGLRLALDRTFEERGVRLLFFRVGGATVEIGASLRSPAGAESSAPSDDRFFGAAYRVDDVEAARARLQGAGVDVSDVRTGNKPGTRVFTVKGETHGVPTLFIGEG
jgi:catechol 2,3-dioxygenase-like lactoylglutathione lyase family enzyme